MIVRLAFKFVLVSLLITKTIATEAAKSLRYHLFSIDKDNPKVLGVYPGLANSAAKILAAFVFA